MIRPLLCLLLASLNLGAADQPAGRGFLMLGGITQLVDAAGKPIWKYPAAPATARCCPTATCC